ncbi:GH25 family lysozyme [Streptomyces spiralis]
MTINGIDVSSYQSETYSTSGLSFVFVKATESTNYVNPKQTAQAKRARDTGLVVGFYHFLHPGNVQAQAEYFVSKCASVAGDILVCDWEPTSSGTPSNADKDAFLKAVKKLRPDHRVILYCDVARWTGVDKTSYCGDGLWIADPNHPAGKPAVEHEWLFHQYSSANNLDRNVGNFTGKAALAAWAKGGIPQPAPGTPATEEDDMAISADDLKKIALAVESYKGTNETHDVYWYQRQTKAQVDALAAKVDKLQAQTLTDDQIAKIANAVASSPTLANKIADTIAARLKD